MEHPRFFVEDPGAGRRIVLPRDESRHALRVLRLAPGDGITLFDGTNREFRGRMVAPEEGRAVVEIESVDVVDREPPIEVTLAVAVPKGRRLEDLVRACAEIGARRIVPLFTSRTVVRERPDRKARGERLRRVSIEASKQCGRNRVTEVTEPRRFPDLLAEAAGFDVALLATTAPDTVPLADAVAGSPTRVLLAIGPEGGFAPDEIEAARAAGLVPVTFGRSRLRVATAAAAGLAMVLAMAPG